MNEDDDKIHAGFGQFKKAFENHWKNGSNTDDPSHYLLRFYSIECGLKSLFIEKCDPSHSLTSNNMPGYGHELDIWLNKLMIPANILSSPPQFKLRSSINISSPRKIYRAHEAWRYGVKMDEQNEREILNWLRNANELISRKLMETR